MARKLTHDDVGAWVLKASPDVWNYERARSDEGTRPGEPSIRSWTLGTSYRTTELVKPGDAVVLLVTGSHRPGVYEVGVTSAVPERTDGMDPTYAVDSERAKRAEYAVAYWAIQLRSCVATDELKSDDQLGRMEHFSSPQMTNPTYLTKEQWQAFEGLAGDRVPPRFFELLKDWQRALRTGESEPE